MIMRINGVTMTVTKAIVTAVDEISFISSTFLGRLRILIVQYIGTDTMKTMPLKSEASGPLITGQAMIPSPIIHKSVNMSDIDYKQYEDNYDDNHCHAVPECLFC